ncbi:serine protease [Burkholderia ubonensis]|uniref:Serine protease n=1 Tax=Burkholderia ubonensis TaxID=101571 RepID=A0AB73FQT2_9BURK|nr:CAP domain-containing protein [Burkholderia ubonensis]KVK87707.1 serine protease [Burkholderia ubonensis]KVL66233.1 serine protease [Burkholderia ubonensis]KVM19965.1 serine protease [Burkholderia ubonensis]KVM26852.1 serine protease [Burkholderia ubonensis]
MKKITTISLSALSAAALLALAACGGGGDGGGTTGSNAGGSAGGNTGGGTPAAQTPTSNNVTTPTYASGSMESAAFTLLNQQRQACGFPALVENTTLDQAAKAHAQYLGANNAMADTEVSGNQGFTGVTYSDRAAHFGYPSSTVDVTGVSAGYYTNATLTDTQYGEQLVYQWLSGVYHIAIAAWPITTVGVGMNKTTFNGFPQIQGSLTIANMKAMTTNGPLTFPCQGTTGVAYRAGGESPTPPSTSGPWGTPVAVAGNPTDTIVMQSGTMTDTSGNVISLKVLDSSTDPNKLLPKFEGVAYPTSPLQPNTAYAVSITGTVNGAAFSRSFTFTTGSVVG